MEMTTTRSLGFTTPRAASFSSAASATPVCGQAKAPERSARAAASASSCSLACSTRPSSASRARSARFAETGAPIWMALASVRPGRDGLDLRRRARPAPARCDGPVERVGVLGLGHDQPRQPVDEPELLHEQEALAERAGVAQVAARDDHPVGRASSRAAGRSRPRPSSAPRCAASSSSWRGRCPASARAPAPPACSRRSRCRARGPGRRSRRAGRAGRWRSSRAGGAPREGMPAAAQ